MLNVAQAARIKDVLPVTIGRWIRSGRLPAIKAPHSSGWHYEINLEDLLAVRRWRVK